MTAPQMFDALVNHHGLVRMVVTKPFAPYQEGQIAGFHPDVAAGHFDGGWARPCDSKGHPIDPKSFGLEMDEDDLDPPPPPFEIPEDWRNRHHLAKIKLAEKICGAKVASEANADAIIDAAEKNLKGEST